MTKPFATALCLLVFNLCQAQDTEILFDSIADHMTDLVLDTLEPGLKHVETEPGRTLYCYSNGDLWEEIDGLTVKIPHQIIFVDTLPEGRGPEDYLIIRDKDTLMDTRWSAWKSHQEMEVITKYFKFELGLIISARKRMAGDTGKQED